MKFQKTKRYLSLALSAVMVFSAISAGISAAAEGETDTTIKDVTTPYFAGKELLARGVEIEAYSVEDHGKGVCIHVFVYNVQPGIKIDYATGKSSADK